MMLQPQKKKIAAMIIGSMKKDKKPDFVQALGSEGPTEKLVDPNEPETDDSMALQSAAQDMIHAFESKDAKSLVSALKDFMSICGSASPEDESHGE